MAKQTKTPNTRNKKEVKARAKVAAVAATKEFLSLKSREAQKLFEVYSAGVQLGKSPKLIKGDIQNTLVESFGIPLNIAMSVSSEVYDRCASGSFQKTLIGATAVDIEVERKSTTEGEKGEEETPPSTPQKEAAIKITLKDYQYFTELCHSLSGFSRQCKTLLLSLIVFYRYNYHPSNWVHYDRKNIFFLAGLHTKTAEQQGVLTQYLHRFCGLNMRVVGSNQPIVCYDFAWMHDQPPAGDANPLITLGPLSPASLKSIVEKVENSPDAQPPL